MIRARSKQSNHIGMVYLGDDADLMMRMICDDGDDIDDGRASKWSVKK